jgi:hypothetical protein
MGSDDRCQAMDMAPSQETIRYRETLSPPFWAWFAVFSLTACVGIAVGFPLGVVPGLISFVGSTILVAWGLIATTARITLTDDELRINRAHIALDYVGIIATLDAAATKMANGEQADPRAYSVSRPLSAKQSVTLEVIDDDDPHPYWLISTNHPQEFGIALRDAVLAHEQSVASP